MRLSCVAGKQKIVFPVYKVIYFFQSEVFVKRFDRLITLPAIFMVVRRQKFAAG